MEYYLITLSNNQTVPVAITAGTDITFGMEGVSEVERQLLKDYSPEAFRNLKELAVTNSISYDSETGEISLTPKAS